MSLSLAFIEALAEERIRSATGLATREDRVLALISGGATSLEIGLAHVLDTSRRCWPSPIFLARSDRAWA